MPWLHLIRTYGEMIRFSHSVFALPFAVMATFLAGRHQSGGWPAVGQVALIILCMVTGRTFAMTFNRLADARLDALNPRTAERALPSGHLRPGPVWGFLVAAGLAFIAACFGFEHWFDNPWPIRLTVPTLLLLAAYSYAKRVTILAHFCLGVAIGFAPAAAWIAVDPTSLGLSAGLLAAAVLFWIAGFDIIYACQDVDADRRGGLHALPARYGVAAALWISRGSHVVAVAALAELGLTAGLGWLYWAAVTVTASLLAAEQAVVRPNDLSRVNLAFFTINGFVSLLLGTATVADIALFHVR